MSCDMGEQPTASREDWQCDHKMIENGAGTSQEGRPVTAEQSALLDADWLTGGQPGKFLSLLEAFAQGDVESVEHAVHDVPSLQRVRTSQLALRASIAERDHNAPRVLTTSSTLEQGVEKLLNKESEEDHCSAGLRSTVLADLHWLRILDRLTGLQVEVKADAAMPKRLPSQRAILHIAASLIAHGNVSALQDMCCTWRAMLDRGQANLELSIDGTPAVAMQQPEVNGDDGSNIAAAGGGSAVPRNKRSDAGHHATISAASVCCAFITAGELLLQVRPGELVICVSSGFAGCVDL